MAYKRVNPTTLGDMRRRQGLTIGRSSERLRLPYQATPTVKQIGANFKAIEQWGNRLPVPEQQTFDDLDGFRAVVKYGESPYSGNIAQELIDTFEHEFKAGVYLVTATAQLAWLVDGEASGEPPANMLGARVNVRLASDSSNEMFIGSFRADWEDTDGWQARRFHVWPPNSPMGTIYTSTTVGVFINNTDDAPSLDVSATAEAFILSDPGVSGVSIGTPDDFTIEPQQVRVQILAWRITDSEYELDTEGEPGTGFPYYEIDP